MFTMLDFDVHAPSRCFKERVPGTKVTGAGHSDYCWRNRTAKGSTEYVLY